jgi:hypothetical protein
MSVLMLAGIQMQLHIVMLQASRVSAWQHSSDAAALRAPAVQPQNSSICVSATTDTTQRMCRALQALNEQQQYRLGLPAALMDL